MRASKCGCGASVAKRQLFVNKGNQLTWMHAGGEPSREIARQVRACRVP
jgi:hypothetical protein